MKKIITNDPEKCVGCNRCIRVCPIEEANIAQSIDSRIVVKIDSDKCITCGACIAACPHDSRGYEDDTERFFHDLKNGAKIALISAPALKTNFDEWGQVLAWLRELGVHKIYDVSLGADICTWAHIRYLQRNPGKHLITQPCPAIVNYILKHRIGLLDSLSPIHSPMLCTAVYMRKYDNIQTKIAAISPCIAKTHEFEATGLVDYNITFNNLYEYIRRNAPQFPDDGGEFDHFESGLGFLYPMPGGLKENIEHYLGKSLRIDKSEGQHTVYAALNEYAEQPKQNLPAVFDVLNCAEGCNCGTGCLQENKSTFEMRSTLETAWKNALALGGTDRLEQLYEHFDSALNIEDFVRKYSPAPVTSLPVTQAMIEEAFIQLGKQDDTSRKFNCGACGNSTCLEMAIRVAKGVNISANCIEKAHKDISREHDESLKIQTANINNLDAIMADIVKIKSTMGDIIASMDSVTGSIDDFNQMTDAIERIAMQINIISLNASIEAARAGQYGKAFGVVAEEIRNLANNSKASVQTSEAASVKATASIRQINEMISLINKNINESYNEIEAISASTRKIVSKA